MKLDYQKAICYSGYRRGQSPITGACPTKDQIFEDLKLLEAQGFRYLRMYDPNQHARTVLELIKEQGLPFKVMVGIDPRAEVNNPGCPWLKTERSELELQNNKAYNEEQLGKLAALANEYREYFLAVSIGNENQPSWGSDIVPEERLISFARYLKKETGLMVTYNEGAYEWKHLTALAAELDIISVHSYPLWNHKAVEEAVEYNKKDYFTNKELFPGKQIIFTECGWTTECNESMDASQVGEEQQKQYLTELMRWTSEEGIVTFLFEAFDEPWKGGPAEDEPEKHWGIYFEDRTPKMILK